MNLRNTLIPTLVLASIVLSLHISALRYHLYWHNWWFHVIIHILTGITIALTTIFIYSRIVQSSSTKFEMLAAIALPFVLFFAVSWEVFELWSGLIYSTGQGYAFDTAKDIFNGLSGGLIGVGYTFFVITRFTKNTQTQN